MSDIFLSYASEDRERVRPLVEALEEHGWDVWWDREIPPGMTWPQVIEQALADTRAMVVVWTEASVTSKWVLIETSEGEARGGLIPVALARVKPPLQFRLVQAADLVEWDGSPAHPQFRAVVAQLERTLGVPPRVVQERERQAEAAAESLTDIGQQKTAPPVFVTRAEEGEAAAAPPMRLVREIRDRRVLSIMGAYLGAGFLAVEAVSQMVDNGFLPTIANSLTLILYLFGIPGSLTFAWFHGRPGPQHSGRTEWALQAGLSVMAITTLVFVFRAQSPPTTADGTDLDPYSVAVLYFEDLSLEGDLAHVADGFTDGLIDQLSSVRSLRVISSNGAHAVRHLGLGADSIARILGVGTLIRGSVDRHRDGLLVTAELVDGASGNRLGRAATVEVPEGEFLAARDALAESVSSLLGRRLGEDVPLLQVQAGTASDEAWALVQRAERLRTDAEDNFDGGGETSTSVQAYRQADSLLAMAEEVDPGWTRLPGARAQAAYRRAWFALADGDVETTGAEIDAGLEHANRALSLDPGDAYALEQRGTLKVLGFQLGLMSGGQDEFALDGLLAEAQDDLEASVREDPSLATAHSMLTFLYGGAGDAVGALESGRRAVEADAYLRGVPRIYDRLWYTSYQEGEFQDASHWCETAAWLYPGHYRFTECKLWLMAAPGGDMDVAAAWELVARLDSLVPESIRANRHAVGQIMMAGVLRKAGQEDYASSLLAQVDHSREVDPQGNLFVFEAGILASTGDPEGALVTLRRWEADGPADEESVVSTLVSGHWWWDSIQELPEFQEARQAAVRATLLGSTTDAWSGGLLPGVR